MSKGLGGLVDLLATTQTISTTNKKASTETKPICNHNMKCFICQGKRHMASECPNSRDMVMQDNDESVIDDEQNTNPM